MKSKTLQFEKLLFFLWLFLSHVFLTGSSVAQIDPDATEKTKALYANLKKIQNSDQFLFGQEFFNSFRYSLAGAHSEKDFSDSRTVAGAHPAMLGSDFHYYLTKSASERSSHTEAVKWAYQQGFVITFDWHLSARNSVSYKYSATVKDLVNNIVDHIHDDREWYYSELDKVIDILNNDLVVDGERIPVVFRPLHEMNGGWFWWGSQATSASNYIKLFCLTVDYFKERTNSVLFCWSPNTPVNMNYYPGDAFVDVLGVDAYEVKVAELRSDLAIITDKAQASGKVAALTETGNRTANGDNAAKYWKDVVLPAILNDPTGKSKRIAWALTWINSSWSFSYVPNSKSSAAAKQSFVEFKNAPEVIFGDELPFMYEVASIEQKQPDVPGPKAVGEEEIERQNDLELYADPNLHKLTIKLKGFELKSKLSFLNTDGKKVFEVIVKGEETTLNINKKLKPGAYLVKASDSKRTVSKKFLIE